MSVMTPVEAREPESFDAVKSTAKCRIPQRLPAARPRPAQKPKCVCDTEPVKLKLDPVTGPQQRFLARNATRSRPDEARPKSANRLKEDLGIKWAAHPVNRSVRPDRDRLLPAPKKSSTIPRRMNTDTGTKLNRPVITVPVVQKSDFRMMHCLKSGLPDQETIKKREDLELQQGDLSDASESITSRTDNIMQLKLTWQENIVQFENMKSDLKERQQAIMELYAYMRSIHQKMSGVGQNISLPSAEDLNIMNVAKLTPDQLLQLCSRVPRDSQEKYDGLTMQNGKSPLRIDLTKLNNMLSKLSDTCKETLGKRQEIIDWFECLKNQEKGIGRHNLTNKINEFNEENETLKCSLDQAKAEFLKEFNEVVDFLRKGVRETMALQLRTEELTYEVSELNSRNADLKKHLHNSDHLKSNKIRVEELEKELKAERCKKIVISDRWNRAEGQVKVTVERAAQLEAALEQARAQTRSLERKVQQLHAQNEQLQADFDKELNKLTESIRENTMHLEEIADAREKLQLEKDNLEKRLIELSETYNESIKHTKQEINAKVAKLIETEKKYNDEVEDKKKVEANVESMCAQLLEVELAHKDALKELQEKEDQLNNSVDYQEELESTKKDLQVAIRDIEEYRNRLLKKSEDIKQLECNFKETLQLKEDLKSNLMTKDEYIAELEKKQLLQEQQIKESAVKMESYETQLSSLKNHMAQLHKDFGDFEDLSELHEIVKEQRAQLLAATRQNGELTEALRNKNATLEHHLLNLSEQEHLLEQRDAVIKMLSEKDEEHSDIIKLLRNNLEIRAQADSDLNKQLAEKNAQINSLITNVETRKQQISQLEKIILALEDQKRKGNLLKKKDQDKINLLEQKIFEYETLQEENKSNMDSPASNLDSIIKILEDELGSPYESQLNNKDHDSAAVTKHKYSKDRGREGFENFDYPKSNNKAIYKSDTDTVPTKIVMGNFVKKTYISTNDETFKGDTLDRKKAITNMDTPKWIPAPEQNLDNVNVYHVPPMAHSHYPAFRGMLSGDTKIKENLLARNIQFLATNQLRDEIKSKMFKFAGHRL